MPFRLVPDVNVKIAGKAKNVPQDLIGNDVTKQTPRVRQYARVCNKFREDVMFQAGRECLHPAQRMSLSQHFRCQLTKKRIGTRYCMDCLILSLCIDPERIWRFGSQTDKAILAQVLSNPAGTINRIRRRPRTRSQRLLQRLMNVELVEAGLLNQVTTPPREQSRLKRSMLSEMEPGWEEQRRTGRHCFCDCAITGLGNGRIYRRHQICTPPFRGWDHVEIW